jgi:hypothetical protein
MPEENISELLSTMLESEKQNEIKRIANAHGQAVGLVILLREKGILTSGDVDIWEERVGEASTHLEGILILTEKITTGEGTMEDIEQLRLFSLEFSRLLTGTDQAKPRVDEMADQLIKVFGPR